jgi:hypothetical protein
MQQISVQQHHHHHQQQQQQQQHGGKMRCNCNETLALLHFNFTGSIWRSSRNAARKSGGILPLHSVGYCAADSFIRVNSGFSPFIDLLRVSCHQF